MKIGDKAKVIDKESLLYNKTVKLIKVSNEAYIFNAEKQNFKLVVHKDSIQRTIEWESSPDRAETNLDKLLGQNGEFVEERKKQVLAGALGIVQRYCEETPNKMEVVAALFGKELGEEFRVKSCHPEGNCVGCFSKYGFEGHNQTATANVAAFLLLLTGEAVIVGE